MDTQIYLVVAGTFVGFLALAFGLLFPIYRFLTREEKAEQAWTAEAIARRQAREGPAGPSSPGGDGLPASPATPPPPDGPPATRR
jgi:hypothetical protein